MAPSASPPSLISHKPMWEGGEVCPTSPMNGKVPSQGVRELQACKESAGLLGCIPGCNGAGGVYPSMPLSRGVCMPACNWAGGVTGVYIPQTHPTLVNKWAVCILLECFLVSQVFVHRGEGWSASMGWSAKGGLHPGGLHWGGGLGRSPPRSASGSGGLGRHRNEVWGKVIFSEACVKNSVHGGGGRVPGQVPPRNRYTPRSRYTPGTRYPPGSRYTCPRGPGTSPCSNILNTQFPSDRMAFIEAHNEP